MGIIRLFTISSNSNGTQFILKDHPELQPLAHYAKRKEIKRLNIEHYFRGVNTNYKEYTKVLYGPVFGMDDPRNGFIYEHNDSGELLMVDDNDVPITYEVCEVLMANLDGLVKTDTDKLQAKKVITAHMDMIDIAGRVSNTELYNDLIRDEWIPDKSFLIIE